LKSLKQRVEVSQVDLDEKNTRIKAGEDEIVSMEGRLRDAKSQMEKYLREYDSLFRKTHKLTEELEEQMHSNQMISSENQQREHEVSAKKGESYEVTLEVQRVQKLADMTKKKILGVDADKIKVEKEREELKAQIGQITNFEIVSQRKEGELHRKQIDDLLREREILNKKTS